MSIVERKVRRMRWRLEWLNFCRRFVRLLSVALAILAICVVVDKLLAPPWSLMTVAWGVGGALLPLALLWAILTRTSVVDAAIATDQKLALRERLSTALAVGAAKTEMEAAVLADAEVHARPLRAHAVFPMPVWRDLYFMPAPILLAALVGFLLPRYELLKKPEDKIDAALTTEEQKQLARRLESFQRQLDEMAKTAPQEELKTLSTEMKGILDDFQSQGRKVTQAEVLKNLSRMSDRLAERKSELEQSLEAAREIEKFRNADITKAMAEELAKGNFEKAQAELAKLREQLQKGQLSKEQMQKLAQEMKGLAQAAQKNPALSKALQEAAKNLQAGDLSKAAQGLELTEKEIGDLADLLKQLAELDKAAKNMQALQKAQGLPCGGCGQEGCEACAQYEALLKQMGLFRPGETDKRGPGMGGPGQGEGGRAEFKETDKQFKPTAQKMKMDKGEVIGVLRTWGPQLKGEVTAQFQKVVEEYRQSAEDTMAREHVPLEFRTLVRDYFDSIRSATTASKPETEASDGATPGETARQSP